eukprot:CAMPEP_0202022086 /NCGR_PEP_ID=MMETSP0905-20130828/48662_1 /ASSEMBLY_ACC=CAM_ASM_000554 /TAXON_ID=420261 /ORGANISM="Thalassiosira antarctica, Strain CCMP982" /LENGTH=153 /DNA_ID=CAMNT_0048584135 /DNA_START=388 /DNA_END=849 /DNA_ORIENTATION=+
MGLFCTDNSAMVASILSANTGFTSAKRGIMYSPSVDMRIRDLSIFRSRRSGAANSRKVVHVNLRSIHGIAPYTSSTQAKRFVMEPMPSSPRSPLSSRALACFPSNVSSGRSMRSSTKAATMVDIGQPWFPPSNMDIDRHVASSHRCLTVPGHP